MSLRTGCCECRQDHGVHQRACRQTRRGNLVVIITIHRQTQRGNLIVITTIHQPLTVVFNDFDLKAHIGNANMSSTWFESQGYPIPANTIHADHCLEKSTRT
eukprot:6491439-Amphidinium_carterae.1